jgi:DNA-binding PadR family transcriptional regulator
MAKWLQSGLRRDLCIILAGAGELQAQALKTRLSEHYDERIEPKTFYAALDALADGGHVRTRAEGIHDVYLLTDAGEALLREHFEWMGTHLE